MRPGTIRGMTDTGASEAFAALRNGLPSPEVLERRWRALALLNAALDDTDRPRWGFRTDDAGARIGTFDNWGGNTGFGVFTGAGAFVRLFDHESPLSPYDLDETWPGLLEGIPAPFTDYVERIDLGDEPDCPCITTVAWNVGDGWRSTAPEPLEDGGVPDDSWMIDALFEQPPEFGTETPWLAYGVSLPPEVVAPFVALGPVTTEQVRAVAADAHLARVAAVAADVGVVLD